MRLGLELRQRLKHVCKVCKYSYTLWWNGTRMGELTSETPKALLNVNGKPIIWYTINFLNQKH